MHSMRMNTHTSLTLASIIAAAMTLIQVSPLKINPWSTLGKPFIWVLNWLGKQVNKPIMDELELIKKQQQETAKRLEDHINISEMSNADAVRASIISFNNEICRGIKHTKESFIDILKDIDMYERYCQSNPNYPNNRAVFAIENIKRVYGRLIREGGFLAEDRKKHWL